MAGLESYKLTDDVTAYVYPDGSVRLVTRNARWMVETLFNDQTRGSMGNTSSAIVRRVVTSE